MEKVREILLKSLDVEISAEEKSLLEKELAENKELSTELNDYVLIRKQMGKKKASFDEKWENNLIKRLEPAYDMIKPFRNIAIAASIAILILLGSVYLMDGSINYDALFGLDSYPVEQDLYSLLNY